MPTPAGRARGTLCPSGRCSTGSLLIGLVGPDGRVRYLGGPAAIDDDFVEVAQRGRSPQMRFRFAEPCVEGDCANWSGHSCSMVDEVLQEAAECEVDNTGDHTMPACGIRAQCVWFGQQGRDACSVCPVVVHTTV